MVYPSCLASCQTTEKIRKYQEDLKTSFKYSLVPSPTPKTKILSIVPENCWNIEIKRDLVVLHFTWKLKFVSNISPMAVKTREDLILNILALKLHFPCKCLSHFQFRDVFLHVPVRAKCSFIIVIKVKLFKVFWVSCSGCALITS